MSPPSAQPDANEGFVHVRCNACGDKNVWLRCEKCQKSDHFTLDDRGATCSCGAAYGFATCLCGASVPPTGALQFVKWEEGPKALADMEIAWGRVAALGGAGLALVGGGLWWWLG